MTSAVSRLASIVIGAALVSGCAGVREHRGYIIDEQLSQAVQVGVDNKASVEKTLGRPTFTGQFTPNEWYYVSRDTAAFAFRNPHVTQQKVLHVSFDPAGNVSAVTTTGKELVAKIDPVNAKTPTLGRSRGFFQELFGNIGIGSARHGLRGAATAAAISWRGVRQAFARRLSLSLPMTATPAGITYADYLKLDRLLSAQEPLSTCTTRCCSSSFTRPKSCG